MECRYWYMWMWTVTVSVGEHELGGPAERGVVSSWLHGGNRLGASRERCGQQLNAWWQQAGPSRERCGQQLNAWWQQAGGQHRLSLWHCTDLAACWLLIIAGWKLFWLCCQLEVCAVMVRGVVNTDFKTLLWFCCQLEVWWVMDADLSTLILVLLPVRGVGRDGFWPQYSVFGSSAG